MLDSLSTWLSLKLPQLFRVLIYMDPTSAYICLFQPIYISHPCIGTRPDSNLNGVMHVVGLIKKTTKIYSSLIKLKLIACELWNPHLLIKSSAAALMGRVWSRIDQFQAHSSSEGKCKPKWGPNCQAEPKTKIQAQDQAPSPGIL